MGTPAVKLVLFPWNNGWCLHDGERICRVGVEDHPIPHLHRNLAKCPNPLSSFFTSLKVPIKFSKVDHECIYQLYLRSDLDYFLVAPTLMGKRLDAFSAKHTPHIVNCNCKTGFAFLGCVCFSAWLKNWHGSHFWHKHRGNYHAGVALILLEAYFLNKSSCCQNPKI